VSLGGVQSLLLSIWPSNYKLYQCSPKLPKDVYIFSKVNKKTKKSNFFFSIRQIYLYKFKKKKKTKTKKKKKTTFFERLIFFFRKQLFFLKDWKKKLKENPRGGLNLKLHKTKSKKKKMKSLGFYFYFFKNIFFLFLYNFKNFYNFIKGIFVIWRTLTLFGSFWKNIATIGSLRHIDNSVIV
jgi:hypothetical protein